MPAKHRLELATGPKLIEDIATIMEDGKPRSYAAAACGVSPRTAERWYREGQAANAPAHTREFYERLSIARKIGAEALAEQIREAASEREYTRIDRHGNAHTHTEPGDWRAAAWSRGPP